MLALLFYSLALLWLWGKHRRSYAAGHLSTQEYRAATLLAFFWPITFTIVLILSFLLKKVSPKSGR